MQHGIFPGYVAPVGKEFAKNLSQLGVDVAVAVIGQVSPSATSEKLQFPIYCVDGTGVIDSYRTLRKIACGFDLVHYFPSKGFELLPLLTPKTKFIFNRLSVSVTGKPWRDRLINFGKRLQPLFAAHVIFTDELLAKALKPIGWTPSSVVPVGYPSDLFYPCGRFVERKEKILIYHGAVRPQRQLDQLIKVLSVLPDEYKLTIIGGGLPADEAYKGQLEAVARSLGCVDRLNLTNMPQGDIRAEIEKAFLCLSYVPMWECYQDQFVLKTVEYLACHRPVMTTATRYSTRFNDYLGEDRLLLSNGTVDDMVRQILAADVYIRKFYAPDNLKALSDKLTPYSTRYVVQHKLLPIYRNVLQQS